MDDWYEKLFYLMGAKQFKEACQFINSLGSDHQPSFDEIRELICVCIDKSVAKELDKMAESKFKTNNDIIIHRILMHGRVGNSEDAFLLFDRIKNVPIADDNSFRQHHKLMEQFFRDGEAEVALDIAKKIENDCGWNAFTWAIIIRGLTMNNRPREALQQWDKMLALGTVGSDTDDFSIISVAALHAAAAIKDPKIAIRVYQEILNKSEVQNTLLRNQGVKTLFDCGAVENALSAFALLRKNTKIPDITSFNILLNGFVQHGQLNRAVELWYELTEGTQKDNSSKPMPDEYTCMAALDAAVALKQLKLVQNILSYVALHSVAHTGRLQNKQMEALVACGDIKSAVHAFKDMRKNNTANMESYEKIIKCLAKTDPNTAFIIYRFMRLNNQLTPTQYTGFAILSLAENIHNRVKVKELLDYVRLKPGMPRNAKLICKIISLYKKMGSVEPAEQLFREARARGEADTVMWTALLQALRFQVEKVEAVFNEMQEDGIRMDAQTMQAVLSSYCQAGRCKNAITLFEDMKIKYHVQPDKYHLRTLLQSLQQHKQVADQKRIAQQYSNLMY